jgi:hypothetical protein
MSDTCVSLMTLIRDKSYDLYNHSVICLYQQYMNMEGQRSKKLAPACAAWGRPFKSSRFADRTTLSDCLSHVAHRLRLDLLGSGA